MPASTPADRPFMSHSVARAGELTLLVEDRGVGFDREMIKGKRRLGLVSMDERVRFVSGTLAVTSRPGEGTQIVARVPVHHISR